VAQILDFPAGLIEAAITQETKDTDADASREYHVQKGWQLHWKILAAARF
jgi:hypothetical protein